MKRDLRKSIEAYKKKFYPMQHNSGAFYYNDLKRIYELSNGDLWDAIVNALMAGFMIGYRYAKREQRKKVN